MSRNISDFNCESCKWGRHCDSRNPAPFDKWVIKHNDKVVFESKTCLKPMPDERAYQMVSLYAHYQNNLLPYSGGILDQPNFFIGAMRIIKGALNG